MECRHFFQTDIKNSVEKIEVGFASASDGYHLHGGSRMVLDLRGGVFQSLKDLFCIIQKTDSGRSETADWVMLRDSAALAKFKFSATWTKVLSCCVFMYSVPFYYCIYGINDTIFLFFIQENL